VRELSVSSSPQPLVRPNFDLVRHAAFLHPLFRARLTHRPDDGGSKHYKTLVNFYQTTRRNIPEDSHLLTCRREPKISY
jgi:hypothetical protein